jgi:hypothetical protein
LGNVRDAIFYLFIEWAGHHHHHDDANDLDDDVHDHESKYDHHDDGAQYLANANYKKELDIKLKMCNNLGKY